MTKRTPSKKDPTFVDQLREIGMSEHSIPDVTFSYADHQYMVRLLNDRDIAVQTELKEYLQAIYEKDNEMLCKNVTTYVVDQLAETLKPFYERMGEIAENIKGIKTDITMIKDRLQKDEDFLKTLDKRVQRLEKYASIGWTITRNVITGVTFAIISIGTAIIVFLEIHNSIR